CLTSRDQPPSNAALARGLDDQCQRSEQDERQTPVRGLESPPELAREQIPRPRIRIQRFAVERLRVEELSRDCAERCATVHPRPEQQRTDARCRYREEYSDHREPDTRALRLPKNVEHCEDIDDGDDWKKRGFGGDRTCACDSERHHIGLQPGL